MSGTYSAAASESSFCHGASELAIDVAAFGTNGGIFVAAFLLMS
eukprot:CAMPEP_0177378032 /NCGR_PEP_ID=MMETSP0368-20130122/46097_1 /TAXON_ID=447022 ORGANISM="Scrippsiella hangoei-like, Strain SHHI-4" /NCGR_SAMPLE_ID=MMETSP0368 /ASSEMBLY_ACC=CAM_ASM_000363 /LENGTH=43 /DNA_ID= /DNA_START= /DNA_END= /DNA_ORIENTATION=